jgi:recombination protein RecT
MEKNLEVSKDSKTLKGILSNEQMKKRIAEVIGKNVGVFTTSVIQIANQNEMLSKAEPNSIIGAAMTAATLDLPLNNNLGFAYIVPYNERQKDGTYKVKAQFQVGAKGFKQLAIRTGQFLKIEDTDIREGEIKSRDRMTGEIDFDFIQDEKERSKKKIIGYVSYFKLVNGFTSVFYMTTEEIEAHAKKFSQTYKKGFGVWKDDFNAMALKTVMKLNLSKNAPLSIEMKTAITKDQAIVSEFGDTEEIEYIDHKDIQIEEAKPILSDDELTDVVAAIEHGNTTYEDVVNDYDLSESQIKALEEWKK